MPKYAKFAALIAVIVGSLVLVATASLKDSQTYYVTIPELHKMASATSTKRVRVGGDVQANSIVHVRPDLTRFNLVQDNLILPVEYVGRDPLPDTFKDGAQALAGGRLESNGVFRAEEIQAKCASKYAPKPGMAPDGLQKKMVPSAAGSSYTSKL